MLAPKNGVHQAWAPLMQEVPSPKPTLLRPHAQRAQQQRKRACADCRSVCAPEGDNVLRGSFVPLHFERPEQRVVAHSAPSHLRDKPLAACLFEMLTRWFAWVVWKPDVAHQRSPARAACTMACTSVVSLTQVTAPDGCW